MNRNDLPEVFFNRLLAQSEFQRKRAWRVELSDARSEPMGRNDLPEVFFNRVRESFNRSAHDDRYNTLSPEKRGLRACYP